MHKQYQLIYADPPWPEAQRRYAPENRDSLWDSYKTSDKHYPLMSADAIASLPVQDLADPAGCVMFIWNPFRHIKIMLRVLEAWGFEYKTIGFVWVKITKKLKLRTNPGYYTNSNTEPCYIATRGRVPVPKASDVHQVILAPITGHSQKPYEAYKRINRLYPGLSKIELFARRKMKGWDVWGNQVENSIEWKT